MSLGFAMTIDATKRRGTRRHTRVVRGHTSSRTNIMQCKGASRRPRHDDMSSEAGLLAHYRKAKQRKGKLSSRRRLLLFWCPLDPDGVTMNSTNSGAGRRSAFCVSEIFLLACMRKMRCDLLGYHTMLVICMRAQWPGQCDGLRHPLFLPLAMPAVRSMTITGSQKSIIVMDQAQICSRGYSNILIIEANALTSHSNSLESPNISSLTKMLV
jgi:hypothetical protein